MLAVDAGLRCGFARYGKEGRLRWYRSQNFGARSRLRRAIRGVLAGVPELEWLVLEGTGPVADVWSREAERAGIRVLQVSAETWRPALLLPREQRTGAAAKQSAGRLARRVIEWSGAPRPTSLRHHAAEAILLGLWGVVQVGWLEGLPERFR